MPHFVWNIIMHIIVLILSAQAILQHATFVWNIIMRHIFVLI